MRGFFTHLWHYLLLVYCTRAITTHWIATISSELRGSMKTAFSLLLGISCSSQNVKVCLQLILINLHQLNVALALFKFLFISFAHIFIHSRRRIVVLILSVSDSYRFYPLLSSFFSFSSDHSPDQNIDLCCDGNLNQSLNKV